MSWNVSSAIDILLDPSASKAKTIDARETMAKFTKEEREEFERRWREAGRATSSCPLHPIDTLGKAPDMCDGAALRPLEIDSGNCIAIDDYPHPHVENFRRPPDSINFRFCENGEWPVMEG